MDKDGEPDTSGLFTRKQISLCNLLFSILNQHGDDESIEQLALGVWQFAPAFEDVPFFVTYVGHLVEQSGQVGRIQQAKHAA